MDALDAILQREIATLSLEVTRIAGAIVVAPLTWAVAPLRARAAVVVLLALSVHGQTLVAPELASHPELVAMAIPVEFLIGVSLGFVIRLVVASAEIAADVIAPQMGLGAAHLFDPTTRATQTPIGALLRHFGILLALLAGLHRVLVGGVLASFRALPPGVASDTTQVTAALMEIATESVVAGVRISMPVIAVLLLTQVALAFVSRAAPAMQVFSIGFAVTLGVGAFVLGLSLPDFARIIQGEATHAEARIEAVLLAFGGT